MRLEKWELHMAGLERRAWAKVRVAEGVESDSSMHRVYISIQKVRIMRAASIIRARGMLNIRLPFANSWGEALRQRYVGVRWQ
jgi:hypothetical protein